MKTMSETASIAKNTIWQILGRAIMIACSLLTTYFLTRFLGVETWGDYIFITNITLMIFNLADFGTGTITIKKLVKAKNKPRRKQIIFSQALTLKSAFTFIALLVFGGLIFSLNQFKDLKLLALFSSLVIIFLGLRTLAEAFFMAHLQFAAKVAFEITASIISIGSIIFISQFYNQINLFGALSIWVASAAISAILAIIFLKKKFKFSFSLTKKNLRGFLGQSAPVGVRQLVFALYDAGIDSFFLKTLIGSTAVGFYGLSYKIYTNLILGAAFFMNSLFPIIIKKRSSNLSTTLKQSSWFLLSSGLLISLLMVIFAPIIIEAIGGEAFLPSVAVLRILALALIFGYLNHLTGYTMIALGAEKQLLYLSLLALLINLAGNWILIPALGIVGAAWTTVATEGSILITTGFFLKKKLKSLQQKS